MKEKNLMKKILLLIDLQNGFNISHHIKSLINFIDWDDYDYCIATKFINDENTLIFKHGYTEMCHTPDIDFISELDNKAVDAVIVKSTYGLNTEKFKDTIGYLEADKTHDARYETCPNDYQIDIIGVDTDACVLATMFNLFDAGFEINLISAETPNPEIDKAAKRIMNRNFFMSISEGYPKKLSRKDNKAKINIPQRLNDLFEKRHKNIPKKGYIFSKEEIAKTTNEERFDILYNMIHEEEK